MDALSLDGIAKMLANRLDRRNLLRRGSSIGLAAGLAGAIAPRIATAQEATPEIMTEITEIPADAPCVFPFAASVRQGPSAGTTLLGYMVLQSDAAGATQGVFFTYDDQMIGVSGTLTGQAVNLIFTPSEGTYIFGVGTSAVDLATCHGPFNAPMGGSLVGPAEGDLGDWAVITDYGDALEGNITYNPGSTLDVAKRNRSPMCRACIQGCKANPSIDLNLCSSFCGGIYGGPCGCGDAGFDGYCGL